MIAATDWTAVAAIGTFAAVLVAVGATVFAAFQGKWDRDAANESATADRRIAAETLDEMRKEREDRTRGHLSFRWVRSEGAPRDSSRKGAAYLLTVKNSGGPAATWTST